MRQLGARAEGSWQTSRKMATVELGMVPGLLERGRSRTMDVLKKFVAVDNHGAVKVGELHREMRSKKLVKNKVHNRILGSGHPGRRGWAHLASARRCVAYLYRHLEWWETTKDGASASRRGLARFLPGHFPRNRRVRMGSHVTSVQGFAPGSEKQEDKWKQNGKIAAMKEAKDKGTTKTNQARAQFRLDLRAIHPEKAQRPPWKKRWKVLNNERGYRRLQVNGEGVPVAFVWKVSAVVVRRSLSHSVSCAMCELRTIQVMSSGTSSDDQHE